MVSDVRIDMSLAWKRQKIVHDQEISLREDQEDTVRRLYIESSHYKPHESVDFTKRIFFLIFRRAYHKLFVEQDISVDEQTLNAIFSDSNWVLLRCMVNKDMHIDHLLHSAQFKNAVFGDRYNGVEVGIEIYIEICSKNSQLWEQMVSHNKYLSILQQWIKILERHVLDLTAGKVEFEDHSIDEERLQTVIDRLNRLHGTDRWHILKDYITYISFDEFIRNMHSTIDLFLSNLRRDETFSVHLVQGQATRKSCIWLTSICVISKPLFRNRIVSHFDVDCRNRVIIDDAGYSGKQMKYNIDRLKLINDSDMHVHLIVPYITNVCFEHWLNDSVLYPEHLDAKLYQPRYFKGDSTSIYFSRIFLPLGDVIDMEIQTSLLHCKDLYMFYFQHGAADHQSICHELFNYDDIGFVRNCEPGKRTIPSCIRKIYQAVIPNMPLIPPPITL